jgi:phage replication O-like protein O
MANPQTEDGFTKIANELLDALCSFRIAGEIRLVFDSIIRKTYGFHQSDDHIANSQIVKLTKLSRQSVSRALKILIEKRLVIKTDDNNPKGHKLKINKDFEQWIPFVNRSDDKKKVKKVSSKKRHVSSKLTQVVNKTDDKVSSELMDTKDKRNYTKETIQKKAEIAGSKDPTPKEKSILFFGNIERVVKGEKIQEVTEFMTTLHSKHQNIGKGKLWTEVKDFCMYWTEKTSSGRQERWQTEITFEVERRLVTWLNRAFRGFSKNHYQDNKPKGKEIII